MSTTDPPRETGALPLDPDGTSAAIGWAAACGPTDAMASVNWLAADASPAHGTAEALLSDPNVPLNALLSAKNAYKTLIAAGYRHTVGRPKKGEKAIGPQLELLYGRGSRTITKYIAEVRAEEEAGPSATQPATMGGSEIDALRALLPNASIRLGKKGRGSITLPFESIEELKRVIARLSSHPE